MMTLIKIINRPSKNDIRLSPPKAFLSTAFIKNGSREDKQPIGVCESVNLLSLDDFFDPMLIYTSSNMFSS